MLPFADGAFDGVRADRVPQHLTHPGGALAEMVRVTEPGGPWWWRTQTRNHSRSQCPGVRRELTDAVKRLRRDVGYRKRPPCL